MTDYNALAQAIITAEADLIIARQAEAEADDATRPAAEVNHKAAQDRLNQAKASWQAAVGGAIKKDLISRFSGQNLVGCASFGVLMLLIIIAWALNEKVSKFLASLADVDTTRGVISGIIVSVTVLLAIILIFAAISSSGSDNEKSFNRGKEVFVVLVGICGTCVGYYFSQGASGARSLTVTGPQITYSEQLDNAKIDAFVSGGRGPWQYEIHWEKNALPKVPATMTSNGGVTLNIPLPKDWKDSFSGTMTLSDASGLSQSLVLLLHRPASMPAQERSHPPHTPPGTGGGEAPPASPPPGNPPSKPAPLPTVNLESNISPGGP